MNRTLIVSNRLPVTFEMVEGRAQARPSAGGLATALGGVQAQDDSWWLGWPGDVAAAGEAARDGLVEELRRVHMEPVFLTHEEVRGFYEGFSNQVIWPLLHHMPDRIPLHSRNWEMYVAANERFAKAAAALAQPGDTVWVHDYQLMLVPAMLRRLAPSLRIGFFLHVPFPSYEMFRTLPWREPLLRGLLGADLIGFHTYGYQRHFAQTIHLLLGLESDEQARVEVDGRTVRLGAFPIGIDVDEFEGLGRDGGVEREAQAIRESAGGRAILLGVDRLDYTKGVPRRLLAFERLLQREPRLAERVQLIQLAVPTRDEVPEYERFRRTVHELVGRINGAHASVHNQPLQFLHRSVSRRELVALYRAADVMLVTPLRDGMNLVAKEFVASRVDEDGVLVLSEFAGAAAELVEAISVNPWDIDGVTAAMTRALRMPPAERRLRMRSLRRRVRASDAQAWAASFIAELRGASEVVEPPPVLEPPPPGLLAELRGAPHLTLLLDYDGTLVPHADSPGLAAPDEALLELLARVAARPNVAAHLVSGRDRETMEAWFGALPIGLHAEHGLWSRWTPAHEWARLPRVPVEWKERVRPQLDAITLRTPGSLVEEKSASLAWHYRRADPELAKRHRGSLAALLRQMPEMRELELLEGEKVIELRVRGVNKGAIVGGLHAASPGPTSFLAIGDDRTDEDLFAALPEGSVTVHVGPRRSAARFGLDSSREVRALLAALL